jgi:hypothetical protein
MVSLIDVERSFCRPTGDSHRLLSIISKVPALLKYIVQMKSLGDWSRPKSRRFFVSRSNHTTTWVHHQNLPHVEKLTTTIVAKGFVHAQPVLMYRVAAFSCVAVVCNARDCHGGTTQPPGYVHGAPKSQAPNEVVGKIRELGIEPNR